MIIISYDYNTWKNYDIYLDIFIYPGISYDLHFRRSVLQNIAFSIGLGESSTCLKAQLINFLFASISAQKRVVLQRKVRCSLLDSLGKHAKLCDQYLGGLEEVEWTREVYVSVVEHWILSKLLTLAKVFLLPKEQDTTNTVREFTTVQADVISRNIVPPPPNGQFFLVQRGPSKCLGEVRTQLIILYF